MDAGVSLTREGRVARILFARPPHNFFNLEMLRGIADALDQVDADPALHASVLAGAGPHFCAGADLGTGGLDPAPLYAQAIRIFSARKPIVAAVQGAAVGGGLGLALTGDFRVASPATRFVANFTKIGIHPGFAISHVLPRIVGEQRAAELLLLGDPVKGERAAAIGLVDRLVGDNEIDAAALALARQLADNAPLAVQSTRATLRAGMVEGIRRQLEIEIAEQLRLFDTEDYREGVAAVRERRPGNWTGR